MIMRIKNYTVSSEQKYWLAAFIVIGLIVGAYKAGYAISKNHFDEYLKDFRPLRKDEDRYRYINPLVGTDSPNAFDIGYHTEIKRDLDRLIKEYSKKGLIDSAIYYRQLNTSVWFGMNENEDFYPASLLKIPVALAVYREGEVDQTYLQKRLTFTQEIKDMAKSRTNSDTSLVVGQSYTVRDLVKIMLVNSDNSARDLLSESLDQKYLDILYDYLNIQEPSATRGYSISMADYALFFRMLYSATFISEDHSEELLSYLTQIDFPYGLTRDLPSSIKVAHKWGVFNIPKDANGSEAQELHECGIVYQLDKPYLLCIMTKGVTQSVLADFIATVSRELYDFSLDE